MIIRSSEKLVLDTGSLLETLRPNHVLNEARPARLNALECIKVTDQTRDQIGWLRLGIRAAGYLYLLSTCARWMIWKNWTIV